MREKDRLARFEQTILPHLDAAYNLARWLTRNEHDAEDMVQEAYLRAFKFFNAFRGVDGRGWLLTIVRNTCYTWLQQNRAHEITTMFDEEIHSVDSDASNPATLALQSADQQILRKALDELPVEFREVVVLRDLAQRNLDRLANDACRDSPRVNEGFNLLLSDACTTEFRATQAAPVVMALVKMMDAGPKDQRAFHSWADLFGP